MSDALVGVREWNDPEVVEKATMLLSGDKEAVTKFIKEWRKNAIEQFLKCWELTKELEMKRYPNSVLKKFRDVDNREIY